MEGGDVLDLFWISLGILCGISGAYSAWDTMPRTVLQWLIMLTVGAVSGWLGGIVLAVFGLELMAFLGAMAAGFFATWGVFVGLRGRLVSHDDLGDRLRDDTPQQSPARHRADEDDRDRTGGGRNRDERGTTATR